MLKQTLLIITGIIVVKFIIDVINTPVTCLEQEEYDHIRGLNRYN